MWLSLTLQATADAALELTVQPRDPDQAIQRGRLVMSDQQQLRQRREALAQAVDSHDLEAVLAFIHPSFVGKTKRGSSVGYQDMISMVEQLFAPGKDYQETVEIEESELSGDSAKLVVRRIERGRLYNPKRFQLLKGLGIIFSILSGWAILDVVRAGEWNFNNAGAVVGYAVASMWCLWWAFFRLRRSVHRTVRYQETWRTIDGRWLLVAEQEL